MSTRILLVLVLAVTFAAAGCGGGSTHNASVSHRKPSASRTYGVVAPILYLKKIGHPLACNSVLQSLPPASCGGVPVAGYDFKHVPGVVHFHGMGWQTPPLRLIGTWDGHRLTVTETPVRVTSPQGTPGAPRKCTIHGTAGEALVERISHDASAIGLLSASPCRDSAWVLVPVADKATISSLQQAYGDALLVSGWLRPH